MRGIQTQNNITQPLCTSQGGCFFGGITQHQTVALHGWSDAVGCDSIAKHHCQEETVQDLMTGFDACVVLRRTRGVTQWRK